MVSKNDFDINAKKPNMNFLWNFIENMKDVDKKPVLDIIKEVYEATYYKYSILYFEEKFLREKYEKTIVSKNIELEKVKTNLALLVKDLRDGKEINQDTIDKLDKLSKQE